MSGSYVSFGVPGLLWFVGKCIVVDVANVFDDVVDEFLVVDGGVVFDPCALDGDFEALEDAHVGHVDALAHRFVDGLRDRVGAVGGGPACGVELATGAGRAAVEGDDPVLEMFRLGVVVHEGCSRRCQVICINDAILAGCRRARRCACTC